MVELDKVDLSILSMLQENAKVSLDEMSRSLKVPKSTIAYRVKRMESMGVIRGYYAYIDPSSLNYDYMVISLIRGKYGKDYHVKLGEKIASLRGVWGVYFVLGDTDFVVMARYKSREDFTKHFLERIMDMPEVERSSTQVVVNVIKETPNVVFY